MRIHCLAQDILAAFKLSESKVASTLPMFGAYLREVCGSLLEGLESMAGHHSHDLAMAGVPLFKQGQSFCGDIVQVLDFECRRHEE